jgi:formylglycine-generating enzyme required for sulfatase activity
MCADPPALTLGTTRTLRRGSVPILAGLAKGNCANEVPHAGSVAASFDIAKAGKYQVGITSTRPAGIFVALQVRTSCGDAASAIDCNSNLPVADNLVEPTLTLDLSPGRYYAVTGGNTDGSADIELGVALLSEWKSLVRGGTADASVGDGPRLLDGAEDRTPLLEPIPDVTVDRLLRVRVVPNQVASTSVVLRGVCAGTQAMLSQTPPNQAVVLSEATTCVDTEGVRVPVPDAAVEAGAPSPSASEQGSFGISTYGLAATCGPAPAGRDVVCITGGTFLFGDQRLGAPERLAVMPSFWMDRHEMTVADYRALEARFHLGMEAPVPNDATFPPPAAPDVFPIRCTYSDTPIPGSRSRENWPLNCIPWGGARFICRALGGDLPTEAEWEYAASAAGRTIETEYPWGDDPPACVGACKGATGCHEAVFGRGGAAGATWCYPGYGPVAVPTTPGANDDVAATGVMGLSGSVAEHALDAFEAFDSPCWRGAGIVDPACVYDHPPERSARGAGWLDSAKRASVVGRIGLSPSTVFFYSGVGLRCVYGAPRP